MSSMIIFKKINPLEVWSPQAIDLDVHLEIVQKVTQLDECGWP